MKKIYRSRTDKKWLGICGGLAEILHIDATLLRLLLIVAIFFSSGTALLVYIVAAFVIPYQDSNPNSFFDQTINWGAGNQYDGGSFHHQQSANQYTGPTYTKTANPYSTLDEQMKEIEKKALEKEIAELKRKISEYEKGER